MITFADLQKLLSSRSAQSSVLSLYLRVPLDPPGLREVPARADELLARAARGGIDDPGAPVRPEEREQVRQLLGVHARDWLGHTVAIFAARELGLSEVIPLPCPLPDRAVLATRPHVRPLLVALQRRPVYYAAVVDRRRSWVFRVSPDGIETISGPSGQGMPSRGFGGWYGLEAHRVQERIIGLARQDYRDTAAALIRVMDHGGQEPLVIGGHEQSIPQLLAMLPAATADRFAGSFAADPSTLTAARVRELADPVIERWGAAREQRLVAEVRGRPADGLTVTGLQPCLAAVNERAVRLLVAPVGGLIPGFVCQRCGALSSTGADCPDWGAASLAVPDLIEEMVTATLADGGQVQAVDDPLGGIAALLRFPLATDEAKA